VQRLVEEYHHTRQSIRRNIEADNNDVDSGKDINVGNGVMTTMNVTIGGGIASAIDYGNEMVTMEMMGGE
jgi:hypothetical protein